MKKLISILFILIYSVSFIQSMVIQTGNTAIVCSITKIGQIEIANLFKIDKDDFSVSEKLTELLRDKVCFYKLSIQNNLDMPIYVNSYNCVKGEQQKLIDSYLVKDFFAKYPTGGMCGALRENCWLSIICFFSTLVVPVVLIGTSFIPTQIDGWRKTWRIVAGVFGACGVGFSAYLAKKSSDFIPRRNRIDKAFKGFLKQNTELEIASSSKAWSLVCIEKEYEDVFDRCCETGEVYLNYVFEKNSLFQKSPTILDPDLMTEQTPLRSVKV